MRVIFTGGGTGGHIYPALALAKHIQKNYSSAEILYIGTKKGLEAKIVPEAGIPFKDVEVEGWKRKFSFEVLQTGFKAFKGLFQSLVILRTFKPQVVVGTGGYVCGPVVLAAKLLKIPTVIHEQNALPGLTNKVLSKIVNKVMITFPDSLRYFSDSSKVVLTGLPVREEIINISKQDGLNYFNLKSDKITLLVSGGSRGAKRINETMVEVYPELMQNKKLQIIHITGEMGYTETLKALDAKGINVKESGNIILKPYLFKMEYALAAADFYIARAGATFISEVTVRGLPGILIPYPYAAENHQEFNARSLVERDAAIMILEKNLNGTILFNTIKDILKDNKRLLTMAHNAKDAGNPESLKKIMKVLNELISKTNN